MRLTSSLTEILLRQNLPHLRAYGPTGRCLRDPEFRFPLLATPLQAAHRSANLRDLASRSLQSVTTSRHGQLTRRQTVHILHHHPRHGYLRPPPINFLPLNHRLWRPFEETSDSAGFVWRSILN